MIFGKYAAIAGAVALGVSWPFATGQLAQTFYQHQIKQGINKNLAISTLDYQRGYLSSEILTKIELTGKLKQQYQMLGLPTEFEVSTQLSHGFFSVSSHSQLVMTQAMQAWRGDLWPSVAKDASPVELNARWSVVGGVDFEAILAAIDGNKGKLTIESSQLTLEGTRTHQGDVQFNLALPHLLLADKSANAANNHEQIQLEKFQIEAKGQVVEQVWLGEQHIRLAKAQLTGMHQQNIIENIKLIIAHQIDKPQSAVDDKNGWRFMSHNQLDIGQWRMTSGNTLTDLSLGFVAKGLDFVSLRTITQSANFSADTMATPEGKILLAAIENLITKGLTLQLTPFSLSTTEGKLNGELKLQLMPSSAAAAQNPFSLLNNLQGEFEVTLPKSYAAEDSMFNQVQPQLIKQGFIDEQQAELTIKATIKGVDIISPTGTKLSILQLYAMLVG